MFRKLRFCVVERHLRYQKSKPHICQVPIKVLEQIANLSVVNSACKFESCTWRSCDDKSFLHEVQLFTPIVEKVKWYRISIYSW